MSVATLALILVAPLMFAIAVAVKLSSPGPVLYSQPRVGINRRRGRRRNARREADSGRRNDDQGGRIFTIYKFRTMRVAAPDADQVWAAKEDPRVTRIGKFLRAYRLDELPQFFNVIRGDMNIVGPRPEQPCIFAELRDEVSDYKRRQAVLPGITGLAQVSRGYDQSLDDVKHKVDMDLEYIEERSALRDLQIMLQTPQVMVTRKGSM